jgi:hypothetical protein
MKLINISNIIYFKTFSGELEYLLARHRDLLIL